MPVRRSYSCASSCGDTCGMRPTEVSLGQTVYHMSPLALEIGALVVTLLIAMEMRRQQQSWRAVLATSLIALGVFTAMIVSWRAG